MYEWIFGTAFGALCYANSAFKSSFAFYRALAQSSSFLSRRSPKFNWRSTFQVNCRVWVTFNAKNCNAFLQKKCFNLFNDTQSPAHQRVVSEF
jgi:hypothetical protein